MKHKTLRMLFLFICACFSSKNILADNTPGSTPAGHTYGHAHESLLEPVKRDQIDSDGYGEFDDEYSDEYSDEYDGEYGEYGDEYGEYEDDELEHVDYSDGTHISGYNPNYISEGQNQPDILSGGHEQVIIELMQVVQEQEKVMEKLLRTKDIDLSQLSLRELNKAISCLESEYEILQACKESDVRYAEVQTVYIPLLFELMRRLKTKRYQYKQKTEKKMSPLQKAWIPLGVTVGVGGLLFTLDYCNVIDMDLFEVIKYSVLAGAITGVVVYKDEILGLIKSGGQFVMVAADKVGSLLGASSTGVKIGVGVASLVAAGAVVYTQKDKILGAFGLVDTDGKRELSCFAH